MKVTVQPACTPLHGTCHAAYFLLQPSTCPNVWSIEAKLRGVADHARTRHVHRLRRQTAVYGHRVRSAGLEMCDVWRCFGKQLISDAQFCPLLALFCVFCGGDESRTRDRMEEIDCSCSFDPPMCCCAGAAACGIYWNEVPLNHCGRL